MTTEMQTRTDSEIGDYFWASVKAQAMQLPWCTHCQALFFHPRPICPKCWTPVTQWKAVSGKGKVWSHSVVRYPLLRGPWPDRLPYTVAFVTLDEGPRVLSNIVDCAPEEVHAGMPVQLVYRERDGQMLYLFAPQTA